jgi:thymidylate synthase (FAD)
LDHGYLEPVESWGSDERIVEAARMSTDKGFRSWAPYQECRTCHAWRFYGATDHDSCSGSSDHDWRDVPKGDFGLLSFLYGHRHSTPFEFAGLVIEVQAPIFVFREWHRHRTQSYNEMSARYTPLPDLNYVPTVERLMLNSKTNKQAGTVAGAAELTPEAAEGFRQALRENYAASEALYQLALLSGVPKELARVHLPVGRYSRMRASANLRNWLLFLTLRMDQGAQWEIRQYANAVGDLIAERFPRTWELFMEVRL